ncbi:hypothetical protein MPSEU_000668200 [Mayamaea pseudoterrestris]|nr:hypothetical protein MPSEU_000668200 [Mayamaea pseudoterrestris]
MTTIIRWKQSMSHCQFMELLASIKPKQDGVAQQSDERLEFHIDYLFIMAYLQLEDDSKREQVVSSISQLPPMKLVIEPLGRELNSDGHDAQLRHLFAEMGKIPSFHDLYICAEHGITWVVLKYAFLYLRQIKSLEFRGHFGQHEHEGNYANRDIHINAAHAVVAGLKDHPSLESASLNFTEHLCCHIMLSVLKTIQTLRRASVKMHFSSQYEEHELEDDDIGAIAAMITSDARLEYLKLENIVMYDENSSEEEDASVKLSEDIHGHDDSESEESRDERQTFYECLARATVEHLEIGSCFLGSPSMFAKALAVSQIKTIHLRYGVEFKGTFASFLAIFAARMSNMGRLEDVYFEIPDPRDDNHVYNDTSNDDYAIPQDLFVELVRSAMLCPTLKRLKLEPQAQPHSEALNQALAEGIAVNTTLEDIDICCWGVPNGSPSYDCQPLLEALNQNFSLCNLNLRYKRRPWSPQLQAIANIICRLNKEGRGYVQKNPTDAIAGSALLGAVSDDIECVYYHVREYPLLLLRNTATVSISDCSGKETRKRKALDGTSGS